MKYPTNIVMWDTLTWARIHKGWNLDPVALQIDAIDNLSFIEGKSFHTIEDQYIYMPRVKWCEKYGSGCDNNGEWHAEWIPVGVQPGNGYDYTVVWYE